MRLLRAAALLTVLSLLPLCSHGQSTEDPTPVPAGVMAKMSISKVPPVYPRAAKEKHISGSVLLRTIIGKDGHVENLTIISGPEELRASAMDAVRNWVYQPYLLNGEPTEVETTITVNYNFGGGAPPPPSGSLGEGSPSRPYGPTRISGGVMAGQILTKRNPVYPAEAREKHLSGSVVLRAVIAKDGTIANLTAMSGPDELRRAAVDAVSQWTYKPYLLNGQPTEVDTTITVNFNIGPGWE